VTGNTPSTKSPEYYGGDVPFVKPGDLDGIDPIASTVQQLTELGAQQSRLVRIGATLVSCIGNLGKVGFAGVPLATNQQINSVEFHSEIVDDRYGYYLCKTLKPWMERESSATTIAILNKGKFGEAPFPLAPLAEQKRIADKLDTVLTRVDAVNIRLTRVAPILKRFRQSVLAAATSGRLTEDWRQSTSAGRETPKNWTRCALKQIGKISTGLTPSKAQLGFYGGDVPFVKPGDLDKGVITSTDDTLTLMGSREARMVRAGAVFVSCIGNLGKVGVAGSPMAFNQQINAIEFDQKQVLDQFGYYSCMTLGEWLEANSSATTIAIVNKGRFEQAEINVPPLSEQKEIVRRIEILLNFADRLDARLQSAQTATERLTPALLAKAFRGELVPQDPHDEPASELLRRLQREAPSTSTRRGRKNAV